MTFKPWFISQSINNVVRLGSANTKTAIQDTVKKVLELTEK